MFWFDHGWFWFIPLLDGTTSVGAVCWPYYLEIAQDRSDALSCIDTIAMCPPLAERLRDAKLTARASPRPATTPTVRTACTAIATSCSGDAFAFVDPVFSSGVLLAMNSAFHGADVVDAWLRDPSTAAGACCAASIAACATGSASFTWFIYRMTNPAIRRMFMGPRNYLRMQEAVLSLLAGDLFRGTPIYWSLRAFKLTYYLFSLSDLRTSLNAWRRRRRLIRAPSEDPAAGAQA